MDAVLGFINVFCVGDSISVQNILLFAFPVLFFCWYKRPNGNFPPGPRGFPLVGVLPYLSEHLGKDFKKWSLEKYGPVMSIRTGRKEAVVLNTYDSIKEAFVKNGFACSGRGRVEVFSRTIGNLGITFTDYDESYKAQKKFVLKYILSKDAVKVDVERLVNDEGDKFIEHLTKCCENLQVDLKKKLYCLTSNVIYEMFIGKRYEYSDPQFAQFLTAMTGILSHPEDAPKVALLRVFPFLINFSYFSGVVDRVADRMKYMLHTIQSDIDKYKESADLKNPKNYSQAFLAEQKFGNKAEERGFKDRQLSIVCMEMFIGGSESTSTTLSWIFIYLLNFPKYYKLIEQEIDDAFETCDVLSMAMRSEMPITCAFIQEVMRHKTVIILGIPHVTTAPIVVDNYSIPKGIKVFGNLYGAHMDPETWPNPEEFNPHRHIDENGEFVSSKKIIPFVIGMRFCVGESLAKVQLFFHLVKILKNFKVYSATDLPPPLDKEFISIEVFPNELLVRLKPK